ncbi:hypothetical protein [Treponema pedis]|uniref:Transcriptional regulator n=1 Tax=Treponema pedis TaxID=409322 RepID=A0A7S6WP99_9SPIR|nr:hypothetical protein [Treponema pedis]QOW60818.1 hypothetical protein IFE08_13720 [Treponema pedis]
MNGINLKVNIGLIISEGYEIYLKKIASHIVEECNLLFLVAKNNNDIITHFQENYDKVDAFVFSGIMLYDYFTEKIKKCDKPCYTITDDTANIYKELLKIFVLNENLRPERVYIDIETKNGDLGLASLFHEKKMPYILPWDVGTPEKVVRTVFENHKKLWKEKKIDLSITKFGMLLSDFKKEGIRYHFIYPSETYLLEFFKEIIEEIQIKRTINNKIFSAYIYADSTLKNKTDSIENDIIQLTLQKNLYRFIKEQDPEIILQKRESGFYLFTTIEDLPHFIHNMTSCNLQSFLKMENMTFSIGYGTGKTISQAKRNSLNSFDLAKKYGGNCSFFISENQSVMGPLTGDKYFAVYNISPAIDNLAIKMGIDKIYLYKIISYIKKTGDNVITAKILSQILNITVRSSNRILNGLQNVSYVKEFSHKVKLNKGRPSKFYKLLCIDSYGNIV